MQSKEVKKWQDEEALKRYQMIAPLLDDELDDAKRRQLREEIAEKYEISKRSLYRYEARYSEEDFAGLRPMNREKRRSQALPEKLGRNRRRSNSVKTGSAQTERPPDHKDTGDRRLCIAWYNKSINIAEISL